MPILIKVRNFWQTHSYEYDSGQINTKTVWSLMLEKEDGKSNKYHVKAIQEICEIPIDTAVFRG